MCGFSLVDDVSDEPRSVVGIPDSLDPPVGKIDPVESCEDVKISKLSGNIFLGQGSGCGSVGRAVASNTRGPRFESSHRQKIIEHLSTVNCVLKRRK